MPFSLPKTVLNVELTVGKTVKSPGRFCRFNALFFQDAEANVPCDGKGGSSTSLKGFTVTTNGVPDENKTYLIPTSMNGGWAIDTSSTIELTEHGLLNSVEAERTNRRAEVVVGIVKGIAGILTKASVAAAPAVKGAPPPSDEDNFKEKFLANWQLVWNFERLDPDTKKAYIAKWQQRDSALFAARAAYRELEQLGDNLNGVMSGSNGAASAATLLSESRKEITDRQDGYFLGSTETVTWSPIFEVEPVAAADLSSTLIAIGDCGAVIKDGMLLQNPLPPNMTCEKPGEAAKSVTLKVLKPKAGAGYGDIKACLDGDLLKGIPFAVPVEATANVDGFALPGQKIQIAQWGVTSCLTFPGSTYTASVSYYAPTGAIKSVKFTQKSAFSKEAVDTLAGIAGDVQKSILDAREKARQEAKNKPLEDLKFQREVLEEKVKIQAACVALKISCEF